MITLAIKSFYLWTPFSLSEPINDAFSLAQPEKWEIPPPDFIDRKKQRKLNDFSKLVLHSAIKCSTPENRNFITVLSSRNGDINNALKVLQDIAKDELVSPQMFVNSVLNMPFAHYSIFFQNDLPSSAISSSESSLGYGFLETALNLKRFCENDVLLTCADLPLNGDLETYSDTPCLPYSLSMIISNDDNQKNRFCFEYEPYTGQRKQNQVPDALEFYFRFLNGSNDTFISETSDSRFTWKRQSPVPNF